ncbi:YdcF family protein, partial [Candidatus Pacearchaeota archaeon]|nr:YdcF family protein [Candidatus Pacearchaeota archaeon]
MKPDLIMILSGEDLSQRHRSKKAIALYRDYNGEVPILISGSHSGFFGRELPKDMERECRQAEKFLMSKGIPRETIICEEQSLDTLGNFYFSHQLIEPSKKKIALITDPFHMNRSRYCANLVFGEDAEFISEPTDNPQGGLYISFIEWIQRVIIARDMETLGIKKGDYKRLRDFIERVHPF